MSVGDMTTERWVLSPCVSWPNMRTSILRKCLVAVAALCVATACQKERASDGNNAEASDRVNSAAPLSVFVAGSLARPMRAALDSFAARTGTTYELESAGSLELARRLRDLGKVADVVALADEDVFPRLLMPAHVSWYARFARNRLVLAHSGATSGLADTASGDWRKALLRPGVEIGRADPDLDPAGYRTLMLFQLAERHFHEPGLGARLLASSPGRHVRAKSAELVALLQAHELDYAWMYESSARGARLPFIEMPAEIDLGTESLADTYAAATVRVLGAQLGDTLELHGTPIRYGISIPRNARSASQATTFLRYLLSPDGRRVLRGEFLDVLDRPQLVGAEAPPFLDSLAVAPAGVVR